MPLADGLRERPWAHAETTNSPSTAVRAPESTQTGPAFRYSRSPDPARLSCSSTGIPSSPLRARRPATRTTRSIFPVWSACRQCFFDQTNPLYRLHRAANVVFISRRAGKHQWVEDNILRRHPILFRQQFVRALRNLQFSFSRERLRLHLVLVDAAHHDRRAKVVRDRHHFLEFVLAVF